MLSPAEAAFVLIDDGVVGRFGAALAWAVRSEAASLDVLVDGSDVLAPGVVARRAGYFSVPVPVPVRVRGRVRVWAVDGRSIGAAPPALLVDASAESSPPPELVALLESHGLEVVWEHGVLRGEVLGLEVARTVGGSLEVGVGRHDRMARFEMRPSEPLSSALTEAAAAVVSLRRPDAPIHPANRLARSRWLRSLVIAAPSSVGLSASVGVSVVAPPLPWFDLPEAGAAPCVGVSASSGALVVAVCSVGVDLDLVPTAADCRALYGGGGKDCELWLVMPAGDDVAIQHEMAALLDPPARVVTVQRGWESGLSVA